MVLLWAGNCTFVVETINLTIVSNKKVFVSGCYDLLHSGHVEFFRQASQYVLPRVMQEQVWLQPIQLA